ncbi:unnamed protein product [Spirodela intermedia]|uniref:S1 motif domain-containing protein n=1 Tax=Spirodela intermedia TaxID=51605 RepID=A0A7I8JRS6_SPIIN|nr:unnamed protein product [Spirodela intermedia]CAA6672880.1 unnamed protein product [Spirodela intermedia]
MVPAIPYSFGSVAIFAVSSSTPSKEIHVSRCNAYGRPRKPSLFQQRVMLPQSLTFTLMQKYRRSSGLKSRSKIQGLASVETDVATDEPNPAVAGEADSETSVLPLASLSTGGETSSSGPGTTTSNQGKRTRAVRKSEMPPVKNEELLPGASFTGKVRSIQPFGAFVDFGAFTDGLVHVSNLSSGFVKDVGSFVSVGQEVKVKILEANMETGRISLTMRDGDETNRSSQRAEASDNFNSDKPRTPRKNGSRPNQKRDGNQKTSKFVKGQVLDGTVKNLTRSGAFINLPEGEEGFLPTSEESEGFSVLGSSSLQVGQEVNVRVLRITRGQVTLTMKKEEDLAELNKILNKGVVYAASNPFELAFRKNKDIALFLDDREKLKKSPEPVAVSETLENVEEAVTETPAESVVPAASTSTEEKSEEEAEVDPVSSENDVSSSSSETGSSLETPSDEETSVESPVSEDASEPITENKAVAEEEPEDSVLQDEGSSDGAAADEVNETNSVAAAVTEAEESPEEQVAEESSSAAESAADGPSAEGADSGQTASSDAPPVEETARSSAGASPGERVIPV